MAEWLAQLGSALLCLVELMQYEHKGSSEWRATSTEFEPHHAIEHLRCRTKHLTWQVSYP